MRQYLPATLMGKRLRWRNTGGESGEKQILDIRGAGPGEFRLCPIRRDSCDWKSPADVRANPASAGNPQKREGYGLQGHVDKAKAEGKREIIIPGPISIPVTTPSLDESLSRFTAVIATRIQSRSFILVPHKIGTWYKFRIVEHPRNDKPTCSTCSSPPNAPAELLPLKEGEFLLLRGSGTVEIDGIRVTSVESGYPRFIDGRNYLLLLDLDSSSGVARNILGSNGAFYVLPNGNIKPLNSKHRFRHEGEALGSEGNAVERLKEKIKAQNK